MNPISLLLAGAKWCVLKTLTAETISTVKKEDTFRNSSTVLTVLKPTDQCQESKDRNCSP